jgi:hypothetical protein
MDADIRQLERQLYAGEISLDRYLHRFARTQNTLNFEADYVDLSRFGGLILIDLYGEGGDAKIHTLGPWLDEDDNIMAALEEAFDDLGINIPIEIDRGYSDPDSPIWEGRSIAIRVAPNPEFIENTVMLLRKELGFPSRIGGEIRVLDIDYAEEIDWEETCMPDGPPCSDTSWNFPPSRIITLLGGCDRIKEILSSPEARQIPFTFAGNDARVIADEISSMLLSRDIYVKKPISLGFLPNVLFRKESSWLYVFQVGSRLGVSRAVAALIQIDGNSLSIRWSQQYDGEDLTDENIIRDSGISENICWLPHWLWLD